MVPCALGQRGLCSVQPNSNVCASTFISPKYYGTWWKKWRIFFPGNLDQIASISHFTQEIWCQRATLKVTFFLKKSSACLKMHEKKLAFSGGVYEYFRSYISANGIPIHNFSSVKILIFHNMSLLQVGCVGTVEGWCCVIINND